MRGCCPGWNSLGFFYCTGEGIQGKILKIALDYPAELCYSIYRTKKCRPLVLLGYQT